MADERGRPEPVDLGRFKNVTPWDAVYGCGGDSIGYPVRKRVVEDFTDDERDLIRRAVDVLLLARRLEAECDEARAESAAWKSLLLRLLSKARPFTYDSSGDATCSGCGAPIDLSTEEDADHKDGCIYLDIDDALAAGGERNAHA